MSDDINRKLSSMLAKNEIERMDLQLEIERLRRQRTEYAEMQTKNVELTNAVEALNEELEIYEEILAWVIGKIDECRYDEIKNELLRIENVKSMYLSAVELSI